MALITETSDPELHASLKAQWESEDRPGWIVVGGHAHYQVFKISDNEVKFKSKEWEELHESTSFR